MDNETTPIRPVVDPPWVAYPPLTNLKLLAEATGDMRTGTLIVWTDVRTLGNGNLPLASADQRAVTGTVRVARDGETPHGVTLWQVSHGGAVAVVCSGDVEVRATGPMTTIFPLASLDFGALYSRRKLERDNADLTAAVAAQALQLTEERERASALSARVVDLSESWRREMARSATEHIRANRAERLAANRLDRIRELGELDRTNRRRISMLIDNNAEAHDTIETLKRERDELRDTVRKLAQEEPKQPDPYAQAIVDEVRSWATHSCPPHLGNPTREEAIEALRRIRVQIPSIVDALLGYEPRA